jgi:predicted permease
LQALISVILPVFLVIGAGYLAVWRGWISHDATEALMTFAQTFAIPSLLFLSVASLDLGQHFDPAMLGSFYFGALTCFGLGILGARVLFGRPWTDAVAIGFICMFSNSVLIGLSVTEQAYGPGTTQFNFAIIALNAPIFYGIGIAAMEIARFGGKGLGQAMLDTLKSLSGNPLVIGIAGGLVANLSGLVLPGFARDTLTLLAGAGLPVALFALGGILVAYRPEGDMKTILYIGGISLFLHPILTWVAGRSVGLEVEPFRAAVLTAAMAPGVNGYIFANIYGVAKRVAASSVLISTAASVITAWIWLLLLP